ncbi:hypothetical protein ACTXT7_004058 [Hymenolepis weldensis]
MGRVPAIDEMIDQFQVKNSRFMVLHQIRIRNNTSELAVLINEIVNCDFERQKCVPKTKYENAASKLDQYTISEAERKKNDRYE